MLIKAEVMGIALDPDSNNPIVVLKLAHNTNEKNQDNQDIQEKDQLIPIWIGILEASSIAQALQSLNLERPMTHDLFKNFMDLINISIVKIDIYDLKDNTFYSKIDFVSKNEIFSMDARPSDAIALALRFKAPIFVDDKILDKTQNNQDNQDNQDVEILDKSEEGKKMAEYLKKLSSEDFGKYKI